MKNLGWVVMASTGILLLIFFWIVGFINNNYVYEASPAQAPLVAVVGLEPNPPAGYGEGGDLLPGAETVEKKEKPFPVASPAGVIKPFSSAAQVEILPGQDDKIKILFLGSDQRPNDDSLRTDVMILAVVDVEKRRINLLSFPRDLYVVLPGGGMGRLNTAYSIGGFAGLEKTLENNFGLKVDHYVLTSFDGFQALTDRLGGVDIIAGQKFADWRAGEWTVVPAGENHFDGAMALWYARSRETSNDLDRNRRGQEVLQGILHSVLKPANLSSAGDLYRQLRNFIETDLTLINLVGLIVEVPKLSSEPDIKQYTFSSREVSFWVEPGSKAQVLCYDSSAVAKLAQLVIGD